MKDPPHEIYIIDQRESKRLHYTRRTVDKGLGPLRKKKKVNISSKLESTPFVLQTER